jgi:hypothetical protein
MITTPFHSDTIVGKGINSIQGIAAVLSTGGTSNLSTLTWPTANLLYARRVWNPRGFTAKHAYVFCGATSSGNYKLGIWSGLNGDNQVYISGAQAWPGANQTKWITLDQYVPAGHLYLGLVSDNATGTLRGLAATGSGKLLQAGQEASAYASPPSSLTLVDLAAGGLSNATPWFGFTGEI